MHPLLDRSFLKMMTANKAWLKTIEDVLAHGKTVPPQKSTGAGGRLSFEILSHTMSFDMTMPIVTIKPNTSWLYMCAEPIWVIDGSNRLDWAPEIEKIQAPYSDNQYLLNGAYGPPFKQQLAYVSNILNADLNSRQAVITIWKRNPKPSKDMPCTVAVQFIVRDGKINCIVTMRSSDVGMGLPYDMLTFVCMAAEVASRIKEPVELGTCYITAGSRHIYSDQMEKLSYTLNNLVYNDDSYKPWAMWSWPGIKEKMYAIVFTYYEDRSLYQSIARERLLGASG